jgi:predicted RND superfamily exporter protein
VTWLLEAVARFARRRYRIVFAAFALLVAGSLALCTRLSFDTDVLNLLPRQDPTVRAYIEMLRDFGGNPYLVVAIRLPDKAVVEPYETFADELAASLAKLPELRGVQHRTGNPEELLQAFFPKSFLFLDAAARQELVEKLSDQGIRRRVGELRRQLATPQGLAVKELDRLDPFGLAAIFLGHIDRSHGALRVDWSSGYYLSRDHRLLLVLAEPVRPPQDIRFDERLIASVDRAIAAELSSWSRIAGPDGPPQPEVMTAGPYLTALGDASLIKHDMFVNIATSALGVFVFFLFVFRRAGALLYAFVPLASGLAMAFGFAAVAFGVLSSATSVCAALLIGLGIDFVIVSYGRFVEERRRGVDLEDALAAMSGACGPAVVAGAVTTSATFYAFTFTDFTGLRQMGLLTGTGILFCMASVLLLMPAMLAWSHDRGTSRASVPRLFLHSFGTTRLTAVCMRHPVAALTCGAALALAALAASFHLTFDESMRTMRPTGNPGARMSREVSDRFGSGFDSMVLTLAADSLEEVLGLSDRAAAGAQQLVDQGALQGFSAASSLIPPLPQQRQALAWLERERGGGLALARIRATFAQALREEGLRATAFTPGLELLAAAVELRQPIGVADFARAPQTRLLLDRYLKRIEGRAWKAAVYLYPPDNRWRRQPPPAAVRLASQLGPRAGLSGVNVINQRVRTIVVRDAWIAGLLGLVLVAAILWIDFRSLRAVALALMPLGVGITLMVGGMAVLGIQMNFINIFVTTMIIGIGTDYGIYVLHRYYEVRGLPREAFERGLGETGKAVAAAALSTVVGFGSIVFSHYPGLQSTGKVAVLGALFTSLVAITLLPAYLAWREEGRRREAAEPSEPSERKAATV